MSRCVPQFFILNVEIPTLFEGANDLQGCVNVCHFLRPATAALLEPFTHINAVQFAGRFEGIDGKDFETRSSQDVIQANPVVERRVQQGQPVCKEPLPQKTNFVRRKRCLIGDIFVG